MKPEKPNSDFNYVLDTSVIIAYMAGEAGGHKLSELKNKSAIPFIVLSELYYIIWNKKGKEYADNFYGIVKSWELPVLQPTEKVIITAGRFKAVYKLGIADSYISAFSYCLSLPLVTKDTDYKILSEEIEILDLGK